jgi:hypothetical protein
MALNKPNRSYFEFLRKCKCEPTASSTPAINGKNFETESFSIICLDAIGLQYKLIEIIFFKVDFKLAARPIVYRRHCFRR